MFLKNDIEKFKQETGIKDERADSLIANFEAGLSGSLNWMNDATTTCSGATEESCDLSWIAAFIKTARGDEGKTGQDEGMYDSTWRYAPAELPIPEPENKGE